MLTLPQFRQSIGKIEEDQGSFIALSFNIANISLFRLFPETQGLGLEEIDSIFVRSNSIWDSTKIARAMVSEKRRAITADDGPRVEVKDAVDK